MSHRADEVGNPTPDDPPEESPRYEHATLRVLPLTLSLFIRSSYKMASTLCMGADVRREFREDAVGDLSALDVGTSLSGEVGSHLLGLMLSGTRPRLFSRTALSRLTIFMSLLSLTGMSSSR